MCMRKREICVTKGFIYLCHSLVTKKKWWHPQNLTWLMAPFLVFKGCKFENPDLMLAEIHISAQQKVVLRVPGGLIETIKCLFFTYYICDLEYPTRAVSRSTGVGALAYFAGVFQLRQTNL